MVLAPAHASGPAAAPVRPRHRGIWLLVAAFTAVFIAGPAAWAGTVWVLRHHRDTTATYRRPISGLRVAVPDGQVIVAAGPPGQVQVEQQLAWDLGHPPAVRLAWHGRVLTVRAARCGGKLLLMQCGLGLTIRVPAAVALSTQAGGGAVVLHGLSGVLNIRTTAGSISAVALTSRRVTAAAGAGSLSLQFAKPPQRVAATATTGSVSVMVPRGTHYRIAGWPGRRAVAPGLASATSPRLITVSGGSGFASIGYAAPAGP